MLHVGVLPHHDRWGDVLANLRYVSSTRRTSTAASSARTSATCCGGCAGSRGSTAPSRSSCSPRRRSRTPASSRESLLGVDGDGRRRRRRAARRADDRALEPAAPRRGARPARVARSARRRGCTAMLVARGLRTLSLREEPQGGRADPPLHRRAARRRRRGSRRTGPATRRSSGARSSGGSSRASCSASSATDALELGIDIGLLDASISVGFPGTVASLRQQWGRAGRRGHGLAVLVASEDALDQFFMREPDALLGRRVEAAILDHANPRVLDGHVLAAAFEAPLDDADRDDARRRGARARGAAARAEADAGRLVWAGRDYPAARVSLRSSTPSRSRSSTGRPASCSASSSASVPTRPSTRAPSTCTSASRTSCASSTSTARRARRAVPRGLVHAGEEGDDDRDRRAAARGAAFRAGARASERSSVTEQVIGYQRKSISDAGAIDLIAARPAADELRDRGGLVPARAASSSRGSTRCRSSSRRCTRPSTR